MGVERGGGSPREAGERREIIFLVFVLAILYIRYKQNIDKEYIDTVNEKQVDVVQEDKCRGKIIQRIGLYEYG